jgi:hypothetical protein
MTEQTKSPCGCGEPETPDTVHRTDGPCYIDAPADLQQRIAEAIHRNRFPDSNWDRQPDVVRADYLACAKAALAVVQPELDRLRKAERAVNLLAGSHRRAEQAEDRLERIRDAAALHRKQLISISELYAVIEAMDPAPAHDGPSVREATANDRRWRNGEKAGEQL